MPLSVSLPPGLLLHVHESIGWCPIKSLKLSSLFILFFFSFGLSDWMNYTALSFARPLFHVIHSAVEPLSRTSQFSRRVL